MKLVGLTGGIACGKTTVSSVLKQLGIPVIDCDEIAHDVVRKVRGGNLTTPRILKFL
jgi:dephospho-CoA kinase